MHVCQQVYKIKIENKVMGDSWFIFRRYTDFVRLHAKVSLIHHFSRYDLKLKSVDISSLHQPLINNLVIAFIIVKYFQFLFIRMIRLFLIDFCSSIHHSIKGTLIKTSSNYFTKLIGKCNIYIHMHVVLQSTNQQYIQVSGQQLRSQRPSLGLMVSQLIIGNQYQ